DEISVCDTFFLSLKKKTKKKQMDMKREEDNKEDRLRVGGKDEELFNTITQLLEKREMAKAKQVIEEVSKTEKERVINCEKDGDTLLHYICGSKDPNVYLFLPVMLYVPQSINIHVTNHMNKTPFMCAQENQNTIVTQILANFIQNRTDGNVQDKLCVYVAGKFAENTEEDKLEEKMKEYLTAEEVATFEKQMPPIGSNEYNVWIHKTLFQTFVDLKNWNKGIAFLYWFGDEWDINYAYNSENILHKPIICEIAFRKMIPLLKYVLKYYPDVDVSVIDKINENRALDVALDHKSDDAVFLLKTHGVHKDKHCISEPKVAPRIEKYVEDYKSIESKYYAFIEYLKKTLNKMDNGMKWKEWMMVLVATVAKMLRHKMPLSQELLFWTLKFEISENVYQNTLENAIHAEIKESMNAETLCRRTGDWLYFEETLLKNPCMLLPWPTVDPSTNQRRLGEVIREMAQLEIQKSITQMKQNWSETMLCTKEEWSQLCDLEYNAGNVQGDQKWSRQDHIEGGVKAQINQSYLDALYLFCEEKDTYLNELFHFHSYLSQLLLRAHWLHHTFVNTLTSIFDSDAVLISLDFSPVQSMEKWIEKMESSTFHQNKRLNSAQFLDVLRCLCKCRTVEHCIQAIRIITEYVHSQQNLSHHDVRLEIIRFKNSFRRYRPNDDNNDNDKKSEEEGDRYNGVVSIHKYTDIKMNIVLRKRQNHTWIAIIGEIRFVLDPMAELQRKLNHLFKCFAMLTFMITSITLQTNDRCYIISLWPAEMTPKSCLFLSSFRCIFLKTVMISSFKTWV
ncbi:hypothetical protein RFI_16407, partial [Reticulomyxa filosa]